MSTYVLKRELPDAVCGTEYKKMSPSRPSLPEFKKVYFYYAQYEDLDQSKELRSAKLPVSWVENNPNWFQKKSEYIDIITDFGKELMSMTKEQLKKTINSFK